MSCLHTLRGRHWPEPEDQVFLYFMAPMPPLVECSSWSWPSGREVGEDQMGTMQCFSHWSLNSTNLESLFILIQKVEWSMRFCLPNKFPCNANSTGPWVTLWVRGTLEHTIQLCPREQCDSIHVRVEIQVQSVQMSWFVRRGTRKLWLIWSLFILFFF